MSDRIAALARRAQDDPFFLAWALKEYATSEGLGDPELATVLGCSVEVLGPLGLCRRPRPAPSRFRQDVDQIAARFGVKAAALAGIVRHADALAAMRRRVESERGLLMAARDGEEQAIGDTTRQTEDEPP